MIQTAAGPTTRYVIVCRGPNCRERGGLRLRRRLAELFKHQRDAVLVGYSCFGQCDDGPNVAFYPDATWYGGLNHDDDAERVLKHVHGADSLPRPLTLPEAERDEHLRNIAELVTTLERDRAKRSQRSRWWWPF